ncbi:MAG: hypothetical protein JW900_15905 [Anaerolineae bacterium]|nr:hypothetical protein [Anaerolineae bacterium]
MNAETASRLYYADSYLVHFEARVREQLEWAGQPAVILDRTAFYPASGGQPADRGTLGGVSVVDVAVREADGAVVHVLAGELAAGQAAGTVDWEWRFDHMQQHSGQHVLSAACKRLLDANTVAFHLGSEVCTIDLDAPRISPQAMEPVEQLVNRVIWENRPVTARFVSPSEMSTLTLRRPPQVDGPIRLVDVAGFDRIPCGGTHVAHTGEIGLLKVIRLDYQGKETRVEFLCGQRALADYCRKNQAVLNASAALSVGHWELEQAVARLQDNLNEAKQALRTAQEQSLLLETEQLVREATAAGSFRVVDKVWEGRPAAELRALALKIAAQPGMVALLGSTGERIHLCVARSEGVAVDAAAVLQTICAPLGGKGGGQPYIAQGSAPPADLERVQDVLRELVSSFQA